MKTFNSLHELDTKKKKLLQRRTELEKKIGNNLEHVKKNINPFNLFSKENIRNSAGKLVINLLGKIFRKKQPR